MGRSTDLGEQLTPKSHMLLADELEDLSGAHPLNAKSLMSSVPQVCNV